jgi:hypothetical protein
MQPVSDSAAEAVAARKKITRRAERMYVPFIKRDVVRKPALAECQDGLS